MVSTLICKINGKNGQVFNYLTVLLASNYEQWAIASFFKRNLSDVSFNQSRTEKN